MRDFGSAEVAALDWPVLPVPRETRLVRDLRAMRALIERRWTSGRLAVDHAGYSVGPHSYRAAAFCLKGAAIRVTPLPFHPIRRARLFDALHQAAVEHDYPSFVDMNDAGGWPKALLAIDTALQRAR